MSSCSKMYAHNFNNCFKSNHIESLTKQKFINCLLGMKSEVNEIKYPFPVHNLMKFEKYEMIHFIYKIIYITDLVI